MATKIKNIPFIGGDTQTVEFDFGTKVLNSVVECPLRMYVCTMSTLQPPANITGNFNSGWQEINGVGNEGDQAFFDKLKTLDGSFSPCYFNGNGSIIQIMTELDLTPICNALFGGVTSAMQTALKTFEIHSYAKGSGKDGAGIRAQVYVAGKFNNYPSNLGWGPDNIFNSLSTINTIVDLPCNATFTSVDLNPITSDNKLYIILHSTSASDGTILSEVDIDYINIKLSFARVPDVISPIPITLPDTWSILIKGFSPAWDSSINNNVIKYILAAGNSSDNSNYDLAYQQNKIVFNNWDGFTAENLYTDVISFNKFQIINLLVEQTSTGLRMRILKNGGTVLKYILNSSRNFAGNKNVAILMHQRGLYQADAFINSLIFMPNKNFDDTEAESILRGNASGFEEDELIADGTFQNGLTNWPSHGNGISVSPGKATFTTMGSYINQSIPVLPNNKYILDIKGNCANGVGEYINGVYIGTFYMMKGEFTTGPHTTQIGISMYPTAAGQYVTSVSLKLKM